MSLLLFIVMLFIIVFVIFSRGCFISEILQKSRVSQFKRHSSSFIGDFGMFNLEESRETV